MSSGSSVMMIATRDTVDAPGPDSARIYREFRAAAVFCPNLSEYLLPAALTPNNRQLATHAG